MYVQCENPTNIKKQIVFQQITHDKVPDESEDMDQDDERESLETGPELEIVLDVQEETDQTSKESEMNVASSEKQTERQ